MSKSIGVAILALTLAVAGFTASEPATAALKQVTAKQQGTQATTAHVTRRHIRLDHRYANVDRPYPVYYDRPTYYAPAPFFPFLGIGYGLWLW